VWTWFRGFERVCSVCLISAVNLGLA
jgi:hypothetical protein